MCGHFFDHGVGKVLAQALPIAAAFIPGVGPIASAALSAGAGALGAKLSGGNVLTGAITGGLGNIAAPVLGNVFAGAFPETAASLGINGGADTVFGSGFGGGASSGLGSLTGLSGLAPSATGAAPTGLGAYGINPGIGQGFDAAGNSVAMNSPDAMSFGTSGPGVFPSAASAASSSGASGALSGLMNKISNNPLSALTAGVTLAQALGGNKVNGEQTQSDVLKQQQAQQAQQQQFSQQTVDMLNNASIGRAPTINPVSDYYTYGQRPEASFFTPTNKLKFAKGGYVKGGVLSGGQDDDIDAKLSNGEFVIPADVVSGLGDGANEAGASKLHKFMNNVRKHKTGHTNFPPKAKPVAKYMGALSYG